VRRCERAPLEGAIAQRHFQCFAYRDYFASRWEKTERPPSAKCSTADEALTNFEVLIDRTSIETFANDGAASVSICFLPTKSASPSVPLAGATIQQFKLIPLKPA